MNQLFQSLHREVGMVSLLYDSATEQRTVFVQNFEVVLYVDISSSCQDFFNRYVDMKKNLDDSPSTKYPF